MSRKEEELELAKAKSPSKPSPKSEGGMMPGMMKGKKSMMKKGHKPMHRM